MNQIEELDELLEIIKKIADTQLQEKAWFGQIPNTYVSYFETIHHFMDSAIDIIRDWECYRLSPNQRNLLKQLYSELEDYDTKVHEDFQTKENCAEDVLRLILNDPDWESIRQKARLLLTSFYS